MVRAKSLTSQHKVAICFFKSHFHFIPTGNRCYVGLLTNKTHENGQKLTYEHVKFRNLNPERPTKSLKKNDVKGRRLLCLT